MSPHGLILLQVNEPLPPLPSWAAAYRRLDEVDSTNRWALDYAASSSNLATLPLVVWADRQTAGRGRSGRSWYSDEGVLTFSVLFDCSGWPSPISQIALVVGVAVADAIQSHLDPQYRASVKWPNDVYVGERKVAGILVESVGGGAPRLVVGIGVNVSTRFAGADGEVQQRAACLAPYCESEPTRMEILDAILQRLGPSIEAWREDATWLGRTFPRYCLLTGRSIVLRQTSELLCGTVTGIEPDGRLRIELEPEMGRCGCVSVESGEVIGFS